MGKTSSFFVIVSSTPAAQTGACCAGSCPSDRGRTLGRGNLQNSKWAEMQINELIHPNMASSGTVGVYIYIWSRPPSLHPPPHGLGPQVAAPIPFYLQAIGSISEVQLRIC